MGKKKDEERARIINYYRRFVKDFAEITRPIHQLVRKEEK